VIPFSVVIPTRGDVDLTEIIASYDGIADEVICWDNSKRKDLSVYARYAMIEEARNDLMLTQDDDVIVSNPQAIVDEWDTYAAVNQTRDHVVCNMPPEFRAQPFYKEHALVGFGGVFHRDAPKRAFERWADYHWTQDGSSPAELHPHGDFFHRRCDVVFTALTPRVLVDVPIRNLPYYDAPNRSWRQKNHFSERKKMLKLALQVRDA
jgi:hypothetical protein